MIRLFLKGFGIEGSGAIVAAIYDKYCGTNKIDANKQISNEDILVLKKIFSSFLTITMVQVQDWIL